MTKVNSVIGMEVMQEGRWMYLNFEKWLFWVVILTWIWPNSSPRLLSVQYVENKVTYMNWKVYYSRGHGQIHLAAQFTSGVLLHFQSALWKAGFLVLKGKKWDTPPPPVTPKLKVRELSQSGFWNMWSHPTSAPSFSQISWPQLLAPGTLFRTMTLEPTIGTPQPYSSFKY